MPTVRQQETQLAVESLEVRIDNWLKDMLVPSYSNCSIKSVPFETQYTPESIPRLETLWTTFVN